LHTPFASHVCAPAHESGSSRFVTGEQVPGVARSQSWHVPHEVVAQQTESTQLPVSQDALPAHAPPMV
jgi:hypothetical protein